MLFSKRISLLSIFALMVAAPQVVFATDSTGDATVTSKRYVDSKLPADSTAHLLVTPQTSGASATKRAITTAGTGITGLESSSSTGATNIPTAYAVKEAIGSATNAADISDHTVNGAPLSNTDSLYWGVGVGAANSAAKSVTIDSLDTIAQGMFIIVTPETTSTVGNMTLTLNDFPSQNITYNGAQVTAADAAKVWKAGVPSIFVADQNHTWAFVGQDQDTIYNGDGVTIQLNQNGEYEAITDAVGHNVAALVTGDDVYNYAQPKDDQHIYKVGYNGEWAALGTTLDQDDPGYVAQNAVTAETIVNALTHTVNGAPLSNTASYFYGTSSTATGTAAKVVEVPSITTAPTAGMIIVVNPSFKTTATSLSLDLNNTGAKAVMYNGSIISDATTAAKVWFPGRPSIFVYDGTNWLFAARGYDENTNTTYSSMSVSEGTTGTVTTQRTLTAYNLKRIVQGTTLTGIDTSTTGAVAATDTVTTGIGKLQATKQDKSTAVTHTANTAVGSATQGVYVNADGTVSAMTHTLEADVPSTALFTDTTYAAGTGISITGDNNTITNTGVRSVTASANTADDGTIAVDTNGTTTNPAVKGWNKTVKYNGSTKVGDTDQPVYIAADGTATAINYTIKTSVPANAVFTDTTYDVFTTSANGLVPMASGTGATSMFLKGDGTWATPTDTNTTYSADNTTIELDGTTFKAKTAAVAQNGTALTTGGQVYDYAAPKTTAVTHTANAAVGSTTKPVYIASDGKATEIGYTIQTSVPANAVFTDTTYDVFTGATSSANGTTGLVKQPLIADRTKFLKGDGTWATPTDTTYNDFTGANGTSAGAHGLVPAPTATDNTKFLKGDGTWGTPTDTNTTYSADNTTIELDGTTFKAKTAAVAQNGTALTTGGQVYDYAAPKTTAVTHTANTSVGTQYKGVYVNANGTVSAMTYELKKTVPADAVFTDTTYDVFTGATSSANGTTGLVKQPLIADRTKFLKGDGTWATPTDTTYNDFTGANGTSAGAHGLVPAPTATDNTKFLKGDGTWAADNDTTYSADNTTIELDGTTFKAKTAAVAQNGTALTTGGQVYDYAAPKTTAVTHTANTAVGTQYKGVYVDTDGTVKAMTYELKKTVPADAVFTDSVTTVKNHDGTDGASTAADGSIQVTKDGTTTYPVVRGWDSKQTAPSSAKVGQVLTYSGNTPGASATPNSSVTAKYIQAPVATGDPNATSNPGTVSGLASIWVE